MVEISPRTHIVLLGWYGSDNTGDEAVLQAVIESLHKRRIAGLHALSIDPAKTTRRFGIPTSARKLTDPATLRALRGARALVLGGGGLIQDRTSVYNLPIYAIYVLLAKVFGLRVIGWGLGVEPLDTLLGKLLARFLCGASDHFSVRDAGSKRLLVRAGVPEHEVTVSADPAFLLEPDSPGGAGAGERRAKPLVVFCLRDLPDNRPGLNLHYILPISMRRRIGLAGRKDPEREERFVEAVGLGVKLCVDEWGADVSFLPLWPGRDDAVINRVIAACGALGIPPERLVRVDGSMSPREMATYLGGADLLVSMRLHAVIFAARQGVPSLALAYARKMRGQMRALGAERWVIEVEKRTPSPEEIEMKLRLMWQMRQEQSALTRRAAEQLRQRAEADADEIAARLSQSAM